jgi:hypothetical protein
MGINGSAFNNPQTYNAGIAGDVTYVGSGQDMIIANASQTKAIKFQTGKATTPFFDNRMTILNSGLVGVNTITPTTHLDVNGSHGVGIRLDAAATVTVALTDSTIILTAATTQTVTLPTASSFNRRILTIVNTGGVQKLASTIYLQMYNAVGITDFPPNSSTTLQSNGTNWYVATTTMPVKSFFKTTSIAATAIPNGVATVIPFNTPLYDKWGDVVNGVFTCRMSGVHTFSTGVSLNVNATMSNDVYVELVNQTTSLSSRSGMYLTGTLGLYYGTITTDFNLVAGDTVVVRILQNSGITRNTSAIASAMWFSGRLV